MAITDFQVAKNGVSGDSYTRTIRYLAWGSQSDEDDDALDYAELNSPVTWDNLPRRQPMGIKLLAENPRIWEVTIKYGRGEPDRGTGNIEYEFDFSLSSQKVAYSLQTVSSTAATGSPTDHKGLINVQHDGEVEGVEIQVATSQFSYVMTNSHLFFTPNYLRNVEGIVGLVNELPFLGRPAWTVLFLGCTGRVSRKGDSTVTYRFAYSPNQTNVSIGNGLITVPEKRGWDYLWVEYEPSDGGKSVAAKPRAAYVERVYDFAVFQPTLGFG